MGLAAIISDIAGVTLATKSRIRYAYQSLIASARNGRRQVIWVIHLQMPMARNSRNAGLVSPAGL